MNCKQSEHTERRGEEKHQLKVKVTESSQSPPLAKAGSVGSNTQRGCQEPLGFVLVPRDIFVLRQLHLMVLICAGTAPGVTHVFGSCAGCLLYQLVNPPLLICSHFTLTDISVFH